MKTWKNSLPRATKEPVDKKYLKVIAKAKNGSCGEATFMNIGSGILKQWYHELCELWKPLKNIGASKLPRYTAIKLLHVVKIYIEENSQKRFQDAKLYSKTLSTRSTHQK